MVAFPRYDAVYGFLLKPEWTRQMGKDYTLYARNTIGRQERPVSMREFQTAWMVQHNIPQGEAA